MITNLYMITYVKPKPDHTFTARPHAHLVLLSKCLPRLTASQHSRASPPSPRSRQARLCPRSHFLSSQDLVSATGARSLFCVAFWRGLYLRLSRLHRRLLRARSWSQLRRCSLWLWKMTMLGRLFLSRSRCCCPQGSLLRRLLRLC